MRIPQKEIMINQNPTNGSLRVWWIPQIPMNPFYYPVSTAKEGRLLTEALALYDIFQFENRTKPDYCNAGGIEIFEDGEWNDYDEEE